MQKYLFILPGTFDLNACLCNINDANNTSVKTSLMAIDIGPNENRTTEGIIILEINVNKKPTRILRNRTTLTIIIYMSNNKFIISLPYKVKWTRLIIVYF